MQNTSTRREFILNAVLGAGSAAFLASWNAGGFAADAPAVNEIERMKARYGCEYSIADLTPTVCSAAGVRVPQTATANVIKKVAEPLKADLEGRPVQKTLIYCGDCIGDVLLQKYPQEFETCLQKVDFTAKSSNVMTTVTPVCYATIFCGAGPEVHGIKVYEKPVVKVETLFDVFLEAGKKIAIVSESGNSVITIFRERKIDYIDLKSDEEAYQKTLALLPEDYDLIVVHDCEYDTIMHKAGTEAPSAADARRLVLKRWTNMIDATDKAWKDYDRLLVFAADHGSHMPEGTTNGAHGADIREDSVVNHFYRWRAAGR